MPRIQLNPPKTYDLVWLVGGKCMEIVMSNTQKPLALWKKKTIQFIYTQGILVVVENGLYK